MLKGKDLGNAIAEAIKLKIASGAAASKKEIADYFGIKPPSIYDWIKKGSISKDKLPTLWDYFSDVVGPEHWGLSKPPLISSTKEIRRTRDNSSDEAWISKLSVDRYAFVKKIAEKVADMGDAEFKATEKIFDGTNDALKAGRRTKIDKGE